VTVTSSEIERAAAAGENYSSDIFRAKFQVTLDGRRSNLSLIVNSVPEKGEIAKVNILFCAMLHVRDIRRILKSNALPLICYIFTTCTNVCTFHKYVERR
jgi:hypothetical protein